MLVSANTEEAKGCRPHCCGCDVSQGKKKVRGLTSMWLYDVEQYPQNIDEALNLFSPTASMFIIGENCSDRTCCQQRYTPEDGMAFLYNRTITTVGQEITALYNGTIVTDFTLFASIQNVSTVAYDWKMWWNFDQYCNYKIEYVEAQSYACPYGIPPTPFQECNTCIM